MGEGLEFGGEWHKVFGCFVYHHGVVLLDCWAEYGEVFDGELVIGL